MAKTTKKTSVKGGRIARSAKTGKFVSVETGAGTFRKSPKSATVVKEVSSRRSAALKRLADR